MGKLVALGLVERLKNSDFILETKIATLNQNKSWKQPDRPDAVWKLYFTLQINELFAQLFARVLQKRCSKGI